ncbi:hypothetical protein B0I31_102310 [Saccharothrix carnea]|uniref:Uncharacterized protein n=1 Tax=Saccharothrix carnea TaxID=1280637 RepID=A0A2P8IFU6_SACCR|nr:hypothetical protein B0I31_102310 [Saccharothrix carnea]
MATRTVLACRGLRRSFDDLVAVDDLGFEPAVTEIRP